MGGWVINLKVPLSWVYPLEDLRFNGLVIGFLRYTPSVNLGFHKGKLGNGLWTMLCRALLRLR
ncbi:hypothetical protein Syn6312_1963 [Synechococcus sp. PCC 6312]|nr:hypothetical protein Syn6312_1963 [Synechococcus sp. PCC 6312]